MRSRNYEIENEVDNILDRAQFDIILGFNNNYPWRCRVNKYLKPFCLSKDMFSICENIIETLPRIIIKISQLNYVKACVIPGP